MQVGVVFLHHYQCFLSLSLSFFVVVAAVLEGVHFNFGSGPVLILFQLLNLVPCAVPILLFFGYFTNKLRTKKNAPTIWITFLIEVHAALIVFCSHSNFVFFFGGGVVILAVVAPLLHQ